MARETDDANGVEVPEGTSKPLLLQLGRNAQKMAIWDLLAELWEEREKQLASEGPRKNGSSSFQ